MGAAGADAEKDRFLGGDAAEVIDAGAEGGVEDAALSGVGEGAEAGPVVGAGGGHRVRVHDARRLHFGLLRSASRRRAQKRGRRAPGKTPKRDPPHTNLDIKPMVKPLQEPQIYQSSYYLSHQNSLYSASPILDSQKHPPRTALIPTPCHTYSF